MSCNSANEGEEQSPNVRLLISSAAEPLDSLLLVRYVVKRHIWELKNSHPCVPTGKLRRMVNDESGLRKWLKVHHNNARQAAVTILATMEWREVNRVDMILEENHIEFLRAVIPVHFGSIDNGARSVVYIPFNHWALEKIRPLERSGDLHRFVISFFEQMSREITQAKIKNTTAFSVIVNVDGVSALKLANFKLIWRIFRRFSTVLERYYPYNPLRCIVINCVSPMNMVMFKLILLRGLRMCTSSVLHLYLKEDSNRAAHFLRSIIPSEELPVDCGGWKHLSADVVDTDTDNTSLSA